LNTKENYLCLPYVQNPASEKVGYYDEDGKTLKNFFLKTPIKFSRLTRFSIGIILCSTDGKHIKELIMLRQEARQLRPLHQEQL
jgi:hypothetical protein